MAKSESLERIMQKITFQFRGRSRLSASKLPEVMPS